MHPKLSDIFVEDLQASSNGHNGHGAMAYSANGNGNVAHTLPAGQQSFSMSCEAYRAEHGLVVQGGSVPEPLQTFEAAGFSSNIMDEVYTSVRKLHSCPLARWQCAGVGWLTQPVGIEAMARLPAFEERTTVLLSARAC